MILHVQRHEQCAHLVLTPDQHGCHIREHQQRGQQPLLLNFRHVFQILSEIYSFLDINITCVG